MEDLSCYWSLQHFPAGGVNIRKKILDDHLIHIQVCRTFAGVSYGKGTFVEQIRTRVNRWPTGDNIYLLYFQCKAAV